MREGFDCGGELEDLKVCGTLVPIVAPADDDVTTVHGMTVVAEIPALKFKFDTHALPPAGSDLPQCLTVRESLLDGFNDVAQFLGQHPEEEQDALFVDGFMAQPAEGDGAPIGGTIVQLRVLCFIRRRRGTRVLLRWGLLLSLGNRQKRHDTRPFALALSELAKGLWDRRPRAEAPFNGADVISPFALVGTPRRYGAIFPDGFAPILKQFTVLEAHVGSIRLESGSPNRVTPTWKALRDEILGDYRERDEFRQRWGAAKLPCNGAYRI